MIHCAPIFVRLILMFAVLVGADALDRIDTIRFDGLARFDADQLRRALRMHTPVIFADDEGFAHAVTQSLRAGYQAAGHSDPSVVVTRVAGEKGVWKVTIKAGRHYRQGGITISTEAEIDTTTLSQDLRSAGNFRAFGWDRAHGPMWRAGQPSSFHPRRVRALRECVEEWLAYHGHYDSDVDLMIDPLTDGTARLEIELSSTRPQGYINDIRVLGASRSEHDVVQRHSGLHVGDTLTGSALAAARRRLFSSGSFHEVTVERADDQPHDVVVSVSEHPLLPPLQQPPTHAEALLLSAVEHLHQAVAERSLIVDAIVEFPERPEVRLVLDGRRGLHFSCREAGDMLAGMVLGESGAWLMGGELLWQTREFRETVFADFRLTLRDDVEAPRRFSFSTGLKSADTAGVNVNLSVHPGFFRFADSDSAWQVESVSKDGTHLSRGAVQCIVTEGKFTSVAVDLPKEARLHARLLSGSALHGLLNPPETDTASFTATLADLWDTMLIAYSTDLRRWNREKFEAGLVTLSWFSVVHDVIRSEESGGHHLPDFNIPSPEQQVESSSLPGLIHALALHWSDLTRVHVGGDHWLVLLPQGIAAAIEGRMRFVNRKLAQLHADPRCGPIGCLTIATVLDMAGYPGAERFRAAASQRANLVGFRAEVEPFLNRVRPHWQTIWAQIADSDGWKKIPVLVDPKQRPALQAALQTWRSKGSPPPVEELLDLWWEYGGKYSVRLWLKVSDPNSPLVP